MKKEKAITGWFKIDEELPEEDGFYEVCNRPNDLETFDGGIAYYDGSGFSSCGIYRYPYFWRNVIKKEKIYGKINLKFLK